MTEKGPLRVLVADDHPSVRASLVALLESYVELAVVAQAGDGAAAVRLAEATLPDAVLIDGRMPVLDGLSAARKIKDRHPNTRVVLLSAYEHRDLVDSGRDAGVDAFLPKGTSGARLLDALLGAES